MTWKEVKEQIEAQGVTDEMDLWFIDISFNGQISAMPQEDAGSNEIGFSVTN